MVQINASRTVHSGPPGNHFDDLPSARGRLVVGVSR
jgi:hypothetical protein